MVLYNLLYGIIQYLFVSKQGVYFNMDKKEVNLSQFALRIFSDLYLHPNEDVKSCFHRVAKEMATNKKDEEQAYNLLIENKWRPATPVFINAGTNHFMGAACWISSLDDSMDSIYETTNIARKIFQHGAGIGIPIGNLREKDAYIYEGNDEKPPVGRSSGAVSFMHLFDAVGATTKSGGRSRRAAIMCVMPVNHPDIEEFIKCKEVDGKLSNMNISVAITDDFMKAFKDNIPFNLISIKTGEVVKQVNARKLWDDIVDMAHKTADPGVLFIDTINQFNVMKSLIKVECVNPCLTGDTLISTNVGLIRMDDLSTNYAKYDDIKVLSYDTKNNCIELDDIIWGGLTKTNADIIEIELEDGSTLKMTPEHKIFTENRGYIEVKDITCDDILIQYTDKLNKCGQILNNKVKNIRYISKKEDVYDITTRKNHNFFANGTLVHNCGEITGLPNISCNLSHINLHSFYDVENETYNFDELYSTSYFVSKLMDNIIDKMVYPDPKFKDMTTKYRSLGLGFMGLSDVLYEMDLPYDSKEGQQFAAKCMKTITTAAIESSCDMAKEKGCFHDYEKVKDDVLEIVKKWTDDERVLEKVKKYGLRNITQTTLAPTGSTAISADTSYGMEPCFGLVFNKTLVESKDTFTVINPIFKRKYENESWYTPELIEKIIANNGSLKGIRGVSKEVKDVFVVAHDIKPKDRIDMQSSLGEYVSNSISSTINLPNTATRDDVSEIYRYAYQKGLKGITIYRDGSKNSQPISFTTNDKNDGVTSFVRPSKLQATVHTVETGNGKLYITVSTSKGKIVEMFLSMGKSGQILNNFCEALGRTLSIAFQHGVPIDAIIKTLHGINSDRPSWHRFEETDKKPTQLLSIPDAIAKLLQRYYSDANIVNKYQTEGDLCPSCGMSSIVMIEGCSTCMSCGFSKCS
jgi:ribonucleoside-diphosphate reductase alpha chain